MTSSGTLVDMVSLRKELSQDSAKYRWWFVPAGCELQKKYGDYILYLLSPAPGANGNNRQYQFIPFTGIQTNGGVELNFDCLNDFSQWEYSQTR